MNEALPPWGTAALAGLTVPLTADAFTSSFGVSANRAATVTSSSGVNVQAASVLTGLEPAAPSFPLAYQPSKT